MRQLLSIIAGLTCLVATPCRGQAAHHRTPPASRRYATAVVKTDDSVGTLLELLQVRPGEGADDASTRAMAGRIAVAARSVHRLAGDFDATSPPPAAVRVHTQITTALKGMDMLLVRLANDLGTNCDAEYAHGLACSLPERRAAGFADGQTVLGMLAQQISDFNDACDRAYGLLGVDPATTKRHAAGGQ